jgi:hypothetical protein
MTHLQVSDTRTRLFWLLFLLDRFRVDCSFETLLQCLFYFLSSENGYVCLGFLSHYVLAKYYATDLYTH